MKLVVNKPLNDNNTIVNIKVIELNSTDFNNDTIYFIYNHQIPLIKFLDTGETFNIKNLKDKSNRSLTETLLTITESDLELVSGTGGGDSVDTAYNVKPYASTMTVPYDKDNPNFQITLTGNLVLNISGTVNGDSGIVNLYFTGSQSATLNGYQNLIVTGQSEMIPVVFIHDSDGLKWYNNKVIDTSKFALQEGTILYHILPVTNTGTFTNTGNVCVGTGTALNDFYIGSKVVKANGEEAILATVTDATHFTTVTPFKTNSTNTAFKVLSKAAQTYADGTVRQFRANCEEYSVMNPNGSGSYNGIDFDQNANEIHNGFQSRMSGDQIIMKADGNFKANVPTYVDDAAATADTNLPSNYFYRVGKQLRIK